MKTTMALLALLVLAAACRLSEADDHTYITNLSSRAIRATTSYTGNPGISQFINRLISAGGRDVDEYTNFVGTVNITLSVDGSASSNSVLVRPDTSIIVYDSGCASPVDIYAAKYGTLSQSAGVVLGTLCP